MEMLIKRYVLGIRYVEDKNACGNIPMSFKLFWDWINFLDKSNTIGAFKNIYKIPTTFKQKPRYVHTRYVPDTDKTIKSAGDRIC